MAPEENDAKGVKIIDEYCHQVGAARFPVAWGGVIPSEAEKQQFYAQCLAPWVPPGSSEQHAQEEAGSETTDDGSEGEDGLSSESESDESNSDSD
jgi:hypothetical protein